MANKKNGKNGNKAQKLVDRLRLGGISKSAANAIAGAIPGLGKGRGKGKKQGKKGKK